MAVSQVIFMAVCQVIFLAANKVIFLDVNPSYYHDFHRCKQSYFFLTVSHHFLSRKPSYFH